MPCRSFALNALSSRSLGCFELNAEVPTTGLAARELKKSRAFTCAFQHECELWHEAKQKQKKKHTTQNSRNYCEEIELDSLMAHAEQKNSLLPTKSKILSGGYQKRKEGEKESNVQVCLQKIKSQSTQSCFLRLD